MSFHSLKQMKNSNKGFTMIEMVVSVGVFFTVIGMVSGIFASALRGQARTLAFQELLDQTGYTIEYMGRSIRMAVKSEIDSSCVPVGFNFDKTSTGGGGGIKFIDYRGDCIEFYLDSTTDQLKKKKNSDAPLDLTSTNLKVISFKVGPDTSWSEMSGEQPRVTMFLEAKGIKAKRAEYQPVIKIQTTISQRNPNFPPF